MRQTDNLINVIADMEQQIEERKSKQFSGASSQVIYTNQTANAIDLSGVPGMFEAYYDHIFTFDFVPNDGKLSFAQATTILKRDGVLMTVKNSVPDWSNVVPIATNSSNGKTTFRVKATKYFDSGYTYAYKFYVHSTTEGTLNNFNYTKVAH